MLFLKLVLPIKIDFKPVCGRPTHGARLALPLKSTYRYASRWHNALLDIQFQALCQVAC